MASSLTEKIENLSVSDASADQHWAPPGLKENLDILTKEEVWSQYKSNFYTLNTQVPTFQLSLALLLHAEGQDHLFNDWPAPGTEDEEKHTFFSQVLNHLYYFAFVLIT